MEPGPKDPSIVTYRGLLANPRFRWFLFSSTASNVGYAVYAISMPFLAYRLTGGFLLPGAVLFVEYLAYSLTFLLGPLVDRARDKRTILLASYPAMTAIALSLGLAFSFGWLTPALLLVLVTALSVLWDLPWMANNAIPAWLLPSEALFASQGLQGIAGGAIELLGYAGGGLLLATAQSGATMYLYAALLAIATVCSLPLSITPGRDISASLASSFRVGWQRFRGAVGRPLRDLAAFGVLRDFFAAAPTLMAVLLAPRFPNPAVGYGSLFVALTAGSLLGGVVLGRWNPRRFVGPLMLLTTAATGALLIAGYFAVLALWLAVPVWFLGGIASAWYLLTKYAYLQGATPPEALARTMANLYLFSGVASGLGGLALGGLANSSPLWVWVAIAAGGLLLASLVGSNLRSLRRLAY
ncbi:MAG: hypothetical protein L3K23_08965 [Thermoplasmata archaeon]|nr:hypothetical protein [Thermoplasmata archaeon]